MSPTEDDLRRSLAERPDEPSDGINASRVIALADERRGRRRSRLLSAAAAVIVVGGVATGVGFLAANGDDQSGAANSGSAAGGNAAGGNAAQGAASRAPSGGAGSTGGAAAGPEAGSGAAARPCPSTPPSALLPGGGGTNQFGSSGPLYTKPVATVTVCAYPTQGGATKAKSIALTGDAAQTFASSLENAPTRKPKVLCSDLREADQQTLVVLAETKGGSALRDVTTTINEPPCAVTVTNGTAIRYDWTWPQSLDAQLTKLLDR